MDCSEIQFMVLFCVSDSVVFYCFIWKGGDTVRHIDDARMDMAEGNSKLLKGEKFSQMAVGMALK